MSRLALPAIIALSGYATSFIPPDPGLTRIAPDRVLPRQTPLSVGFWGASAELRLIGPDVETLYGRRPAALPADYPITVVVNDVLRQERPSLLPQLEKLSGRGFLRMVPSIWYGVRADVPSRFVPDGRGACSGRFFWFPTRRLAIPEGWRIVSQRTIRTDLKLSYPNPASAGGGTGVIIHEPRGWSLEDIGLTPRVRYEVNFLPAMDSPYSTWKGSKPRARKDILGLYQMEPRVLAEIIQAVVEDPKTGERRTMQTPTGWVEAAGSFSRVDGSGWPQSVVQSPEQTD